MRKQVLVAIGCLVSSIASAQEWKPVLEKWQACADAAAVRYAKSTESAPVVARLAILSCVAEKEQLWKLSNWLKAPVLQMITLIRWSVGTQMFLLSGSWKCEYVERFDLTALSPSAPTFAMTAVGHSRPGQTSS
jgi:hypothetical protein